MARAGFYAVENRKIRFGRDGRWYADDQPIDNERIAGLFSRSVRPRDDGGWELVVGDERAPIEVDDTPWVVTEVRGDETSGFEVRLNDGSVEPLDPATLSIGHDEALRCRVKNGAAPARFLRAPSWELGTHLDLEGEDVVLVVGGLSHPVRR